MEQKNTPPSAKVEALRAFGLLSGVGIYFVVFLGVSGNAPMTSSARGAFAPLRASSSAFPPRFTRSIGS